MNLEVKTHTDPHHKLAKCRERVSQLETVLSITSLVNTQLDLERLLNKIMQTAKEVMQAEIAALALIDEERGDLAFQLAVFIFDPTHI